MSTDLFNELDQAMSFVFFQHSHVVSLDPISLAVLGRSFDAVTSNKGMNERINEFLKQVKSEGKLIELLRELHARNVDASFAVLFIKYCGASPKVTPFDVYWIPPAKALLDRRNIRDATRDLVSGAIRVLLINGPRRSGKTYCSTLFRHVSEASRVTPGPWSNNSRHALCEIDLRDYGSLTKPTEILQLIMNEIGLQETVLPEQMTGAPRWHRARVSALKPKLDARQQILWLVIDGLCAIENNEELLDFAANYAREAARSTQLRAIFIDCPAERLPIELADNGDIAEELVTQIGIDDVKEFFTELGRTMEKAVDSQSLAQSVWQEVEAKIGQDGFLLALSAAARRRAQQIVGK